MTRSRIAAAVIVALLWGVQFVTSKIGLEHLPPLLFVALRFAGVAVVLLPFVGRPPPGQWRALGLVSIFYGSLCFGLFFMGLRLTQAGLRRCSLS